MSRNRYKSLYLMSWVRVNSNTEQFVCSWYSLGYPCWPLLEAVWHISKLFTKSLFTIDELKPNAIKLNGKTRLINKLAPHNICISIEPWPSCRHLTHKETSLFIWILVCGQSGGFTIRVSSKCSLTSKHNSLFQESDIWPSFKSRI